MQTLSKRRFAFNIDHTAVAMAVSFKPVDSHRFWTTLSTLEGGLQRSSKASIRTQSNTTSYRVNLFT